MAKRAQGLSLTVIVVAALALLVLVAVATFTMGGLSKIFGGMAQTTVTDVQTARAKCAALCTELKTSLTGRTFVDSGEVEKFLDEQSYVKARFAIKGANNTYVHCWEDPILYRCGPITVTLEDGSTVVCEVDTDFPSCS